MSSRKPKRSKIRRTFRLGPWLHGLSGGFLSKEYAQHRAAIRFGAALALIGAVGSVVSVYAWSDWLFSYFSGRSDESRVLAKNPSGLCDLNGKTINLIYGFCIQQKCMRTRQKMAIVGDKIYWYDNAEGAHSEVYQIGATVELPAPPTGVEGTYWKSYGAASYAGGILRLKRERIRYESTSLYSQAEIAWYEIAIGGCTSCGLSHTGEIATANAPSIHYAAFDSSCVISAAPPELKQESGCDLNGKTINFSYTSCSPEKGCIRTRQKLLVAGNKLSLYQNPEAPEADAFQLGQTIELSPPRSTAPVGYFKSYGTASYVNNTLRVAREDIRYLSAQFVAQTIAVRSEIITPQCNACRLMKHTVEVTTKNQPDINYSSSDHWCMMGSN